MRAEGTLLRQQTVKRTFGTRCVGVTLTPPTTRTAHTLALESRGAIDRHVPSAHSYLIRIAAIFQCSRHAASAGRIPPPHTTASPHAPHPQKNPCKSVRICGSTTDCHPIGYACRTRYAAFLYVAGYEMIITQLNPSNLW